jgi:hypothetical protein
MSQNVDTSEPLCLACGYSLRSLSTNQCPECGRGFDLLDHRSFDTPPRRARRRRRRILLCGAAVVLLALFFPHGFYRAGLTFRCVSCGHTRTIKWLEPAAPRWLPFRYPAVQWEPPLPATGPAAAVSSTCNLHTYAVNVTAQSAVCTVTGNVTPAPGEVALVNDLFATPETARTVLKALTAPSNHGIWLASAPASDPSR